MAEPFHLRQRFRVLRSSASGTLIREDIITTAPSAALVAGVSPSYLKHRLSTDGELVRRVIEEDGTWHWLLVERLDRLY